MLDFWHYIIYIYIYDLQYAEYRIFLVIRNLSIIPKQKDSVFILIIFFMDLSGIIYYLEFYFLSFTFFSGLV